MADDQAGIKGKRSAAVLSIPLKKSWTVFIALFSGGGASYPHEAYFLMPVRWCSNRVRRGGSYRGPPDTSGATRPFAGDVDARSAGKDGCSTVQEVRLSGSDPFGSTTTSTLRCSTDLRFTV